jgi:hypothetical protein
MLGSALIHIPILVLWCFFLCLLLWRYRTWLPSSPNSRRRNVNIAAVVFAIVATTSLLVLRLLWTPVEIAQHRLPWLQTENYQHLDVIAIKALSIVWISSSLAGMVLGFGATGLRRVFVVMTCLFAAFLWEFMDFRHPARYLIPDGYLGWVEIRFGQADASPLAIDNGDLVYRIPENGLLDTSNPLEYGSAKDHYFYYSADGKLRELKSIPWESGNMIWSETNSEAEEFFWVGTDEQRKKKVRTTNRKGPYDENVIPDPRYP